MDLLRTLMSVLETLNQGVRRGRKRRTVVYNRAASEMDGLSEHEVIGKSLLDVFHRWTRTPALSSGCFAQGYPRKPSSRLSPTTRARGSDHQLHHPVILDGKIVGACEVSTDITRMRRWGNYS
jgi:arginine utilization regulatory protein